IVCEVPRDGKLHVRIFNVRGELVATLIDEVVQPGSHDVFWDGKDAGGTAVSSGVYFYIAEAAGKSIIDKIALIK
ncbi:MAG: FlgD immunoglobulin-like domain containing protein, partial [bacterium]